MSDAVSPAFLWQREAYDAMLETVQKVSGRLQHRVQELAQRYAGVLELAPPQPYQDLRTEQRIRLQAPLQVWLPDVMDVVLYSTSVDRSSGGLGVHSPIPLEAGARVFVRPAEAEDESTWVPLAVRHCQPDATGWTLGCQVTSSELRLELWR
jgi:hypothetical protein